MGGSGAGGAVRADTSRNRPRQAPGPALSAAVQASARTPRTVAAPRNRAIAGADCGAARVRVATTTAARMAPPPILKQAALPKSTAVGGRNKVGSVIHAIAGTAR